MHSPLGACVVWPPFYSWWGSLLVGHLRAMNALHQIVLHAASLHAVLRATNVSHETVVQHDDYGTKGLCNNHFAFVTIVHFAESDVRC